MIANVNLHPLQNYINTPAYIIQIHPHPHPPPRRRRMSSLESQENKQLLWGILAEEGIFDTVPDTVSTDEVKHVFERIIRNLSASIPALLATRLKELYIAKERAIAEEDYDAAKTIRASIEQIEAPSARILKLEQRKQTAIQAEDYDSAKQIKTEIDRIRAASFSLTELNKIAIQSLATGIPKITAEINSIKGGGGGGHGTNRDDMFTGPGPGTGPGPMPHFPSSQEMYNAEDFQSHKRKDIELKMREKENEMRSFLEIPRPVEIDFSDRHNQPPPRLKSSMAAPTPAVELVHLDYNGAAAPASDSVSRSASDSGPGPGSDSPIGDDMDKLIAERIASRERDLAEITQQIKRSAPNASEQTPRPSPYSNQNISNDIMIMRKPAPPPAPALEHKVRFDENPDIIQYSEPEQQQTQMTMPPPPVDTRNEGFHEDMNSIFLKLKRRPIE